jgi:hypothetical protein
MYKQTLSWKDAGRFHPRSKCNKSANKPSRVTFHYVNFNALELGVADAIEFTSIARKWKYSATKQDSFFVISVFQLKKLIS